MDITQRKRDGLAGEFRVMAELLLRGYNPAKSYLADGADILLDSGIKIEVKAAHRRSFVRTTGYLFNLLSGFKRDKPDIDNCDFFVLWCIDDDCFYIIPASNINRHSVHLYNVALDAKHKWASYKNNWKILEGGKL